ncbi:hypothetical protein Pint_05624 [Pistacia integerrima]|uniref:Uncharacterized protein n=1 Tax=Pistacia integerrima TaxID=434235 RepID=A0ACC0Z4R9_9ROSI|nr:hypothetical protein Pint_05624 [Pistacia integerrima]
MSRKRENESSGNEDGYSKRQKVAGEQSLPSPPRLGFENPLLPLANTYDDDDEDEEENGRRVHNAGGGGYSRDRDEQNGNGVQEDEDDEDEDDHDDQGVGQGKRSRVVELRRDCPYLDTVNRQVPNPC